MCNSWCDSFSQKAANYLGKSSSVLEISLSEIADALQDFAAPSVAKYTRVNLFSDSSQASSDLELRSRFSNKKFDAVLSMGVLEHCREWQDALYQMLSVLRDNGILLLTASSPGVDLRTDFADHWRFSHKDFVNIFGEIAEIISLETDNSLGWASGVGVLLRKKADKQQLAIWRQNLEKYSLYSLAPQNALANMRSGVGFSIDSMLFDQYSRYKACQDIIKKIGVDSTATLLDVGCGPEMLFKNFMPDNPITFVDPLINSELSSAAISGNIFSPVLDGKKFDCVSAIDVYEHIPPEVRNDFLLRASSLAAKHLILAFPYADQPDPKQTDDIINAKYEGIYGAEYSWLDEHRDYGLPSVAETVASLEGLGWHCQLVGHGHAPWLSEFLAFVVCAWDQPQLQHLAVKLSEIFNRELYAYDFMAPHYRQYIVASRDAHVPEISFIKPDGWEKATVTFQNMMEDAYSEYFSISLRALKKANAEKTLCGPEAPRLPMDHGKAKRTEVLEPIANNTMALKSDINLLQTDIALLQNRIDQLQSSNSWRITGPLRFLTRLVKHGLLERDKQALLCKLRSFYDALPLPAPVRKATAKAYRKIFKNYGLAHALPQSTVPALRPKEAQEHLPDYIAWGIIDWHFRHQRPQQLSLALAQTGRRVFYISPTFIDDERAGFTAELLHGSHSIYQIRLFIKGAPNIYACEPSADTVARMNASIGELLRWANGQQLVSLVQHPFWTMSAAVLPNSRLIYDCMDHHDGFGSSDTTITDLERRLLADAELTIVTSNWLADNVGKFSSHLALIRNGCEFGHFNVAPKEIYKDPQGRKIIGYFGAIAEWFDVELVAEVAKKNSECCVLLIGSDSINAKNQLKHLKNVIFTGEVPYKKLPFYLHGFDVCLLPFKIVPLTLATNPVKVYEYLSAGKPVVTVSLPEIAQFNDLVYAAKDTQEFVSTVNLVLTKSEPDELIVRRTQFVVNQTWQHRCVELIEQIETAKRDPKISVVIVTYNNLDLTKQCLDSLERYTHYDNLEIVIVDNASSDKSPEFLSEWASIRPNCKLLLSPDNGGFAKGNNQGLELATGDYLVMLNNDTFVTPGWVRTLLHHLQRNPDLGLVGPVTNNIGNEAKIKISYKNMNEMLPLALAYTSRHIGQLYPLRTAAFFCVMMSRHTYEQVGPLDEAFGRGFFEDDDYCRRVEQIGLRIACAEDVFVHHHLSASFNKLKQEDRQKLFQNNRMIYEQKWGAWAPHNYRVFNSDGDS